MPGTHLLRDVLLWPDFSTIRNKNAAILRALSAGGQLFRFCSCTVGTPFKYIFVGLTLNFGVMV